MRCGEGVGQLVIEVRLYASLRRYKPAETGSGTVTVDVPEGVSLGEMLEELEIDAAKIAVMKVNGVAGHLKQALSDGDRIDLFPPDFAGKP